LFETVLKREINLVTIALLIQLIQSGDVEKFNKVFLPIQSFTDFEARTLIEAIVSAKFPSEVALTLHILKYNLTAPLSKDYSPDVKYVYRGCMLEPIIVKVTGFTASGTSESIFVHKGETGASCYVSCTKDPSIALDFAKQHGSGYIYKVEAEGGIDCEKWFRPLLEYHPDEKEVLFHKIVPPEAIVAYAGTMSPTDWLYF
jgi:hypothetical protein